MPVYVSLWASLKRSIYAHPYAYATNANVRNVRNVRYAMYAMYATIGTILLPTFPSYAMYAIKWFYVVLRTDTEVTQSITATYAKN